MPLFFSSRWPCRRAGDWTGLTWAFGLRGWPRIKPDHPRKILVKTAFCCSNNRKWHFLIFSTSFFRFFLSSFGVTILISVSGFTESYCLVHCTSSIWRNFFSGKTRLWIYVRFRFTLNRHVTVFIFIELNFSSSYIFFFKNNKVVCNIFCNLRFDEIFLVEKPGDGFISVSGLIWIVFATSNIIIVG